MIQDKDTGLLDYKKRPISAAGYDVSFSRILVFFLFHINWLKYVYHWWKTLSIYKNWSAIDLCLPWYNYGGINWVKSYVKKHMKVFEYGTGGSTLFYADSVAELVSVEHNKNWYDKIVRRLEKRHNAKVYLQEPEFIDNQARLTEYISKTFSEYQNYSFEKYVRTIERYPDNYFDLVVIDGRCRPMCLSISLKKVKKGGWILFDNSERYHYQNAINSLKCRRKKVFFGFGPFLKSFWNTMIIKP
jgi:hypothetical protein